MTTPEIQAMIAQFQSNITSLQSILDTRMGALNNSVTMQLTARKAHTDQTPNDAAHATVWATWNAEEAAHQNDPAALWAQPEHAYWLRLTSNALIAGVIDPVNP